MFKLQDGREHLWQWDLDRYVIVEDANIGEVHFCNRTTDCSLVVEVEDGLAAIPNILLQEARPVRCYAYVDDKYTLVEEQLTVKSRTRPDDYVYTETETLQYSTVTQRVDAIEANLPSMVVDEVNNYLTENPIEVDFTGYATETYVDTAISNIDIPEVDFTGYATEDYVDTAISNIDECDTYYFDPSQLVFNQGFGNRRALAPEELIEFATRLNSGEAVSLYYKWEDRWLPAEFISSNNGVIITRGVSHADVGGEREYIQYQYVVDNNIAYVQKYMTSTISIASQEYVDNAIANIDIPETDLTEYATKDYVDFKASGTQTWVTQQGYATEDYVTTAITNALDGIATAEEGSY